MSPLPAVRLRLWAGCDSVDRVAEMGAVAAVSIRNLTEDVRQRLRLQAAANNRSLAAEIGAILAKAVSEPHASVGRLAPAPARLSGEGGRDADLPARPTEASLRDLAQDAAQRPVATSGTAGSGTEQWSKAQAVNRARWDELAAIHGQDAYYDTQGLVAGRDSLTEEEAAAVREAVGSVSGLDVLHVQCHIGFDSISLARYGARVTGVDFSPASLAKAADLAARCGVQVEWVEGDATDLPDLLFERFDLAYATHGVMCWIHDLDAWMRSVFATLRPGGRLVLLDGHPLAGMIATTDPLTFDLPYANDGGHRLETEGSYADRAAKLTNTQGVYWAHSLGEIVTAAVGAGFRVDALTEHMDSSFDEAGQSALEPDGRWRLRVSGHALPLLFTLRASRPA